MMLQSQNPLFNSTAITTKTIRTTMRIYRRWFSSFSTTTTTSTTLSPFLLLLLSLLCITPITARGYTYSPYVIIIDGGSTGSRLHAFQYHQDHAQEHDITTLHRLASSRVFSPLTDYTTATAKELADHLVPLFTDEQVASAIPTIHQAATPVYYAATAGMRLVPPAIQQQVYERLATGLLQLNNSSSSSFPYRIGKFFTLSGEMEAMYGVVACNYLKGAAVQTTTTAPSYVAALDMGGASTQVAVPIVGVSQHNNTTTTQQWTTDSVYAVSHLGYGVDQFQQKLGSATLPDACRNGPTSNTTACAAWMRPHLLQQQARLTIPHDFADSTMEFWAMSLYFYTMDSIRHYTQPLLDAVWPTPTIAELRSATTAFCQLPLETLAVDHPFTNAAALAERCYQAVYMLELLTVMGFPTGEGIDNPTDEHRNIRFLLDVEGSEVEWTLGMALAVQHQYEEQEDKQQQQEVDANEESVCMSSVAAPSAEEDLISVETTAPTSSSCVAVPTIGAKGKENLTRAAAAATRSRSNYVEEVAGSA